MAAVMAGENLREHIANVIELKVRDDEEEETGTRKLSRFLPKYHKRNRTGVRLTPWRALLAL